MLYKIEFYDKRVETNIKEWPGDMVPKFLWLLELIEQVGPDQMDAAYIKTLGNGLFKINAKSNKNTGCALFCISQKNKTIIILDGFIETTQRASVNQIALARTRMHEISLK
jgi:phage-related protein